MHAYAQCTYRKKPCTYTNTSFRCLCDVYRRWLYALVFILRIRSHHFQAVSYSKKLSRFELQANHYIESNMILSFFASCAFDASSSFILCIHFSFWAIQTIGVDYLHLSWNWMFSWFLFWNFFFFSILKGVKKIVSNQMSRMTSHTHTVVSTCISNEMRFILVWLRNRRKKKLDKTNRPRERGNEQQLAACEERCVIESIDRVGCASVWFRRTIC